MVCRPSSIVMNTALVFADGAGHNFERHPEHLGRATAIWDALSASNLLDKTTVLPPEEAAKEAILRVHTASHIGIMQWAVSQGGAMIGPDTYTTTETDTAAFRAAGSAVKAVDAVCNAEADNAIALVRPPGHHAGRESIEGFCLLNNIAIAARHAQTYEHINRVAIVDFDIHHGNGTQDIFYDDSSVLFMSTHGYAPFFYPTTGHWRETGENRGLGYTVNLPIVAGSGDRCYAEMFDQIIMPSLQRFQPDILLISAGYDGHWRDPLHGQATLSLTGYDLLVQKLLNWGGKTVFVLEGGYDLEVLSLGIVNLVSRCVGLDSLTDPIGFSNDPEPDISALIHAIRDIHLIG